MFSQSGQWMLCQQQPNGLTSPILLLIAMARSATLSQRTSDSPRPRSPRRKIVVVASLCLLLAVSAMAWIIWRPLTDSEQRLVGTWRNTTNPAVFTFHSDRTISALGFPNGSWHMHDNKLYTPDSFITQSIRTLLGRQLDDSSALTFIDDNNISVFTPINGGTCTWQRIPEP